MHFAFIVAAFLSFAMSGTALAETRLDPDMLANRQRALDWVFDEEGGFVQRDSEPGKAGNFGIGYNVYTDWMARHDNNPHPSLDDLKNMLAETATAIYETEWMTPLRFDELPSGVDYALFDAAVNLGVGGAVRMLQRMVLSMPAAQITGHMDTPTMDAITELAKTRSVPLMISDAWLAQKKASPEWPQFGKGWTNRAAKVRAHISTMVPPN